MENNYKQSHDESNATEPEDKKLIVSQNIYKYNLGFNKIRRELVYTEHASSKKILNFNIDHVAEKILVFSKSTKSSLRE